jgi:zinc protease
MIKKFYFFSLFLSFTASIVFAQRKLSDNMYLTTLPNGLDVLVVEDNSVPLATIMITFKSGAFTESEQFKGANCIYQGMLFKANKDFKTSSDLQYHAGQLGFGLMNSETSQEYSCSYFTLPKSNLDSGLSFMNTAIRYPGMKDDELENEKLMNDNELHQKESNPSFLLYDAIDRHLWGDLFNRKSAIGTHESINSITSQQMFIIKQMYYYPNNALLIVAGDVAHGEIFKKVKEIYGDWLPSGFDPFKKWPIPEFKSLNKPDYVIVESKLSRTPQILIAWQGPDTRNDIHATYVADVFSFILNQNSSKLKNALVQTGLASDLSIQYLTQKHVGPIILYITPNPLKIKECMAEVTKQLGIMDNNDYLSDIQIETAKRKLEINDMREADITTNYVHTLSFWWASASLDYYANYLDNLRKINRSDLQNYVRKYIKNRPYCAGLLINPDLNAQINAGSFFTTNNN